MRSIKTWLSTNCPVAYRLLGRVRYQLVIEGRLIRRIGVKLLAKNILNVSNSWSDALPAQRPRRVAVPDVTFATVEDLRSYLRTADLRYHEGGHTVYLPPDTVRRSVFSTIAENYPDDAGLKILKNSGCANKTSYVFINEGCGQLSHLHMNLTYNPLQLTLVANMLHSHELGPRLYDLIELECGNNIWTAYVIEHIGGRQPDFSECVTGLNRIRDLDRRRLLKVTMPDGYEDEDFLPPSCNGNALIDGVGRFQYIDFQNFLLVNYTDYLRELAKQAVEETHFGDTSVIRGGRYLYQSVPTLNVASKRDIEGRMATLDKLMESAGVTVRDRLVLDFGCNIGMAMAEYLRRGARWCHGWDYNQVVRHAERLLLAIGCTRFSATGGEIKKRQTVQSDLPEFLRRQLKGCAISYLAVYRHIGWLDALAQIPWSFLIYEGHENDSHDDFEAAIAQLNRIVPVRVATASRYRDGDCEARPAAILIREHSESA